MYSLQLCTLYVYITALDIINWRVTDIFDLQQAVLVEAIRARQNGNEMAVSVILEANRQRRIVRRQQHAEDQQLLKHHGLVLQYSFLKYF